MALTALYILANQPCPPRQYLGKGHFIEVVHMYVPLAYRVTHSITTLSPSPIT